MSQGKTIVGSRYKVTFQKMLTTCPDDISLYAKCVISRNDSDELTKGSCEKEFQALKACFRKAARASK